MKYDKKTRSRNLIKKLIQIVFVLIAVVLAEWIATSYFNDSLFVQIIITIVVTVLFIPFNIIIDEKIDKDN